MKYVKALNIAVKLLEESEIADAKLDAWYLLSYCSKLSRQEYFMCQQEEMSLELEKEYFSLIERRATHVPLQHITGEQEFMGITFAVNEHVLIPRQDTELLVEETLSLLHEGDRVLDMCTGSGCIIISLFSMKQGIEAVGVDVSSDALMIARKNSHNITEDKIEFIQSDLFDNVSGKFDCIVSNPPYIRTEVIKTLSIEVREHDPMIALDGFDDGLFFYRKIIETSVNFLKAGGNLLFEIGYDQGEAVKKLMLENGFLDVCVVKDLSGNDRVVKGHL